MHLHWKYRELVKIISKDHSIKTAEATARLLEAESGGILVAVERVSKGYAIIVYRGKNYQRPVTLRPTTLINKREALKRSLEAQRCEVNLLSHKFDFSEFLSIKNCQYSVFFHAVIEVTCSKIFKKIKSDEQSDGEVSSCTDLKLLFPPVYCN